MQAAVLLSIGFVGVFVGGGCEENVWKQGNPRLVRFRAPQREVSVVT